MYVTRSLLKKYLNAEHVVSIAPHGPSREMPPPPLTQLSGVSDFLDSLERGGKGAVLLKVEDLKGPLRKVVPLLLQLLKSFSDKVCFILASPSIRRSREFFSLKAEVLAGFHVKQHDPSERHLHVGRTRYGTEVFLTEEVVSSDTVLEVSSVQPHPAAGFTGGSELILPGTSSLETTVQHHVKWLLQGLYSAGISEEENLFREDMHCAADSVDLLSLDVVLDFNCLPLHYFSGDHRSCYENASAMASSICTVEVDDPVDVVVADAYPLDTDLYSSASVFSYVKEVCVEGSAIVVLAEAPRGWGVRSFPRYLSLDVDELASLLKEAVLSPHEAIYALKALQLLSLAEERRIFLVAPNLSDADFSENIHVRSQLSSALREIAPAESALLVRRAGFFIVKLK